MTYATVVREAQLHLPELRQLDEKAWMSCLDDDPPLPYIVFGDLFLPLLETVLKEGKLEAVLRICAFLEEVAVSSRQDATLGNLLAVEIGEWLSFTQYEKQISPWLGPETKRVCGYVEGLATQRRDLQQEKEQDHLGVKVQRNVSRLIGKST